MQSKRLVSLTGLALALALLVLTGGGGGVAWSAAPPGPSFDVLDNARAPSTGDEAVGQAYLRLIFPYNLYIAYSDITLHVEETAGHEDQEEDWTQSQGQMSSSGSYPNMYTNWDFGFTSTEYHNGDWEASCTYHWKRYNMMLQVIEEGDASVDGFEFTLNNIVVTDAYDAETDSKNFLISQGDESPVVHAAITAHPYGDARDTITYRVYLYSLTASQSSLGPWTFTDTLAGTTDSIDLTLDDTLTGNPEAPTRGVYAFDVEAVAYYAYTGGHWCDGLPEVEPDSVAITALTASAGDCTATVSALYDIATSDGTSAKLEFYGPTTSSSDITLRNTITGGDADLGSNEKDDMSLSIGVSDTHYLGVAILDENTDRYRSHTARWALANGWQATVPAAACLYFQSSNSDVDALYSQLGQVSDSNATAWWLYRGKWYDTSFVGSSQISEITKNQAIATLGDADVWLYDGEGTEDSEVVGDLTTGQQWVLSADDIPNGTNVKLGIVLCCYSDDFAQALADESTGGFTVGSPGEIGGFVVTKYEYEFKLALAGSYGIGEPHSMGDIHEQAMRALERKHWESNVFPDDGYEGTVLLWHGNEDLVLQPSGDGPAFFGGGS